MSLKLFLVTFVTLTILFYFRLSYAYDCEYQKDDQFVMQGQIDSVQDLNIINNFIFRKYEHEEQWKVCLNCQKMNRVTSYT